MTEMSHDSLPLGDLKDRNLIALEAELDWLSVLIAARLGDFAADQRSGQLPAPPMLHPDSELGRVVEGAQLQADGRAVLALALAAQLNPALLDPFFVRNQTLDRPFTEFGGQATAQQSAFVPTGETALFLIGGTNLADRARAMQLFDPDNAMRRHGLVK